MSFLEEREGAPRARREPGGPECLDGLPGRARISAQLERSAGHERERHDDVVAALERRGERRGLLGALPRSRGLAAGEVDLAREEQDGGEPVRRIPRPELSSARSSSGSAARSPRA